MNRSFPTLEMVRPGAIVSVVFYDGSKPCMAFAKIEKTKPLTVVSVDGSLALLEKGKRLMLIFQNDGKFARTESEVTSCVVDEGTWTIEMNHLGWEEIDRRRYPRYTAQVPLALRTVSETGGVVRFGTREVITEDLSLGGAWVRSGEPLPIGTLAEVEAVLRPGEHARILALVVRSSDSGMALEFLDYIGASRYYMHAFLNRLI